MTAGVTGDPFQAAFPPTAPFDLGFALLWKDKRIGSYRVSVRPADGGRETAVTTRIDMKVTFGPITMFRFLHDGEEFWRSGALTSLKTHTEEHGDVYDVGGSSTPQGLEITGPLGPCVAPPELLTSNALWCRAITRQTRIIDAQNGAVVSFTATPAAGDSHFRFEGAAWEGEMWYDDAGLWSRAVLHRDGHTLTVHREA
ncbi:MAG: hypothetical protein JNM48_13250 [Rhodospirillales bacterium]|nr:hypothetical protein [Rhodospirillales bacterium]